MGHWGWGPSLCQPWMGRLVSPRMEGPLAARMRKPRGSFRRRKALSHPRRRFLLRGRRHTPLSLTASAPSCLSPHFTQEVTAAQRGAATCPRSQRMSRESAWVLPGTAPSFPASGPLRCRDRASPGLDPRRSDFGVPEICRASAEPCLAPRRAPAQ